MKKNIILGMMVLAAGSLMAADSNPKDDVKAAATALGASANYAWHQAVEVPEGGFGASTSDGKTEKDGYTSLSITSTFGDNTTTTQAFLKGTNGAINTPDNGWQSLAEAAQGGGRGGFLPRMLRNNKTPAVQAADLADGAKELKASDKGISGDLTEDSAKTLMTFGRATVTNPKGSVTFTVADGKLVKYSFHVTGSADFNGNPVDIDRTTTVEIKDVGTTKVEVPDDAKKKLE
jgi:hypothetical protein